MGSLSIEERLHHYFLAMGAQQGEPSHPASDGLSLVFGSEKIQVIILKNDDFTYRNKIVDTLLALASLRNKSKLVYLAAPRLFGAMIDAAVFRSYGIGLILFDERRLDEVVAPQPLQAPQQQTTESPDPALIRELSGLRSMYLEMQKNIAELHEELKRLQEGLYRTPNATSTNTGHNRHDPTFLSRELAFSNPGAQLPSFFTNNPWLDVLSKRGRTENEAFAA